MRTSSDVWGGTQIFKDVPLYVNQSISHDVNTILMASHLLLDLKISNIDSHPYMM